MGKRGILHKSFILETLNSVIVKVNNLRSVSVRFSLSILTENDLKKIYHKLSNHAKPK